MRVQNPASAHRLWPPKTGSSTADPGVFRSKTSHVSRFSCGKESRTGSCLRLRPIFWQKPCRIAPRRSTPMKAISPRSSTMPKTFGKYWVQNVKRARTCEIHVACANQEYDDTENQKKE